MSIWSSTSSFSLCSWTGGTKNDIEPNMEEMGCKNVPVWVWTWSGLGPDHYRLSLAVPVPVPEIGSGTRLSSLWSGKNGLGLDQTELPQHHTKHCAMSRDPLLSCTSTYAHVCIMVHMAPVVHAVSCLLCRLSICIKGPPRIRG